MSSRPQVSVCLATFNGKEHLESQLLSVMHEVGPGDELVVVDDGSSDGTQEAVLQFEDRFLDRKCTFAFYENERNMGHLATFRRAILLSNNDLVALCDQDDVWPPGRLNILCDELLTNDVDLVFGSLRNLSFDTSDLWTNPSVELRGWPGLVQYTASLVGLMPKLYSFGSACAFSRKVVDNRPMMQTEKHEAWLIACALTGRGVRWVPQDVTLRRLHGHNLTSRRRLPTRLRENLRTIYGMASVKCRYRRS